jgi:hypothetical protein
VFDQRTEYIDKWNEFVVAFTRWVHKVDDLKDSLKKDSMNAGGLSFQSRLNMRVAAEAYRVMNKKWKAMDGAICN